MKLTARSAVRVFGVLAVTVTLSQLYFFVVSFPGVAAEVTVSPSTTIASVDTFHSLPVPNFLSELSARAFYASWEAGSGAPASIVRYKANEQQPIASLTKLMTALVLLDQGTTLRTDDQVVFQEGDRRGGVRPRLYAGDTISSHDLWRLMLVPSDNDATAALVRTTGQTEAEIVAAMNARAVDLGLTRTLFFDTSGLDPRNVSTPREFAVIARQALGDQRISDYLREPRIVVHINGAPLVAFSSDQLLKTREVPAADSWTFLSGKTGYIDEAGYNVAFLAKYPDGHELLLVLFGAASIDQRAAEAGRLLQWISHETAVQ